jgi:uncharacterized protein
VSDVVASTMFAIDSASPVRVQHVTVHQNISTAGALVATSPMQARAAGTANKSQSGERAATPDDLIRQAIRRRDTQGLMQLLPKGTQARNSMLTRLYALDSAFAANAASIVRLILTWMPDAMHDRFKNSNSIALQSLTGGWRFLVWQAKSGASIDNPPTGDERIYLINLLLDAGANADGVPESDSPLAELASFAATPDTVRAGKLLLEHGAHIDARNPSEIPPLVVAAQAQNGDIVRLMLEQSHADQHLLDVAVANSAIVEVNSALEPLLQAGANINIVGAKYGDPRVPFTPAADASRRFKFQGERQLMQLMIRFKADPNRVPKYRDSPLMDVIHDPEFVRELLALGADPVYHNVASGQTPLRETGPDDVDAVDMLLARGAKLDLTDADMRQYPIRIGEISWAILNNKDALAAALAKRSGKPRGADCGALYYAAATGADRTLKQLLDERVSARSPSDDEDKTPLMVAATAGRLNAVRLLLDSRAASVDEKTPTRLTPISGEFGITGYQWTGGKTALMFAAAFDRADVVRELIRRGANVRITDRTGLSALDYARGRPSAVLINERLTMPGAR